MSRRSGQIYIHAMAVRNHGRILIGGGEKKDLFGQATLSRTLRLKDLPLQFDLALIPWSSRWINSSSLLITTSVLGSRSSSSFPSLLKRTVSAPALRPAIISSMLSPTIKRGSRRSSDETSESGCASVIPQARAMCRMPAGDGFGGRKSRVTMGVKGLM